MNSSKESNRLILDQEGSRSNSISYMPGLDGMRALAVFAVIAYHLNLTWAPGGLLGVNLFFVLSGYLITDILLMQWERSGSIDMKDFWLRRSRRLLPALLVMLVVVMAWVVFYAPERMGTLKQEVLAAVSYTSNWYLILHNVSYFESFGPPSPLGHLWSLAVEGQFYLFWPLLLGLGLKNLPQRKWIIGGTIAAILISVAAMALIYTPGHDPSRVYYGTDTRVFALLAGALLALVWPSRKMTADLSGKKKLALDVTGSMGLMVVLLMIWKTNQYQTFLYQGGLLLFSAASLFLVAALAHPASYLGKLFGWGPLRWLGKCSYGIYLWHYPVIILTSPIVNTQGLNISRFFWQIAVSIILAALSYYMVEKPIRYGRRRRLPRRASGFQRRRQRPLARSARISVSILLMFLLLSVTPNESAQTSAKDLAENSAVQNSTPVTDKEDTAAHWKPDGPDIENDINNDIKGDEITVIGDSMMINAEPILQEHLPGIVIDAQIGRQMYEAPDIIKRLREEGKLGKIVIIELGTNGSFTKKQLTETLASLPESEKILLLNARVSKPWETVVNETLAEVAASYPHTKLIDWYAASKGHDDYFYSDGVHLNQTGARAYGEIIIEALTSKH